MLWKDNCKSSASAAARELCEWVYVGIGAYIFHDKYQVKLHSSSWFPTAGAAAIVHRNNFFLFTKRINLLNLKQNSEKLMKAKNVITNLDLSKVSRPDCIPVVVLKNCEPELSHILAELFNMCLKNSCFPDCWKVSSVVPAFKNVG